MIFNFYMQIKRHVKISSVQLKQRTITQKFVPTSSKIGHFIKNCILTYLITTCIHLGDIYFTDILDTMKVIMFIDLNNLLAFLSLYLKIKCKVAFIRIGNRN